jgi:hypothetical protein
MSSRRSTGRVAEVSTEEQSICVACGMCCDGTLFLHAYLNAGERGNLPEKIERQSYSKDGKDYFRLPCGYFKGLCMIYDRERADVCSAYRCQLLKNYAAGRITLDAAMKVVHDAVNTRKELMAQYMIFSGSRRRIFFKKLLRELGKIQEGASAEVPVRIEYDMLLARCNIFEALLIKHFLSDAEFEKYMKPDK